MRLVLDTNVFVSGVFFSGPPYEILHAWRRGEITLVVSPDILEEYQRVGEELAQGFPGTNLEPMLELLAVRASFVESPPLVEGVCADPDDDKFLACAIAGKTRLIVSGDRHLLAASGYHGVTVLRPREFVDQYLGSRG